MIRVLGIIFIILIFESVLLGISYVSGSTFLEDFIQNYSLEIMGNFLALNIASATFLISNLLTIENSVSKEIFSRSKVEIKHNILFMLIVFGIQLAILSAYPKITELSPDYLTEIKIWLQRSSLFFFLTYLYCIYEIAMGIFTLSKSLFPDKKP